ncbi:hypothetical protein ZWY2020_023106 [Hordeum vulgare]|nr:hypothetical protein ZWY2020_023106 [Hordeum vulgare]
MAGQHTGRTDTASTSQQQGRGRELVVVARGEPLASCGGQGGGRPPCPLARPGRREAVSPEDASRWPSTTSEEADHGRHDVLRVGAVFASTLLRAIRFLQLNSEQLAADIEAGALTSRVNDASVLEAVAGILHRPDPELAQFVRESCCKGQWVGTVTRIRPNTRYLDAIVTGAMSQYISALTY